MKLLQYMALIFLLILAQPLTAQQQQSKYDNSAYEAYYDSIQKMDYPYTFPILGKQAYKKGYDLPYAWGASSIYFTQTQEINISSIRLGVNNSNMADFSSFINFGPTVATTHAFTIRPDVWVFPFLNLYGIIGGGTTETDVTLLNPVSFETSQHFKADSYGLGATLTGKVGPILLIWDNNYNFVDVDVLVEPVPAYNSSIRLGYNFLDNRRPDKMLTVWAGVFYQKLNSETKGNINIGDIFPNLGSGNSLQTLRDWASELPLPERVIANQIIDKIENYESNHDPSNATIAYELEKKVAAPFNLILGAQYQINKNFMFRTEVGVFGKRSQFLLNLNYRFQWL